MGIRTPNPALRGAAMVLTATVAWSFSGVFTRVLSIDMWTTVALRSLAGGLLLFTAMLVQRRRQALRDLVDFDLLGWAAVGLSVFAQVSTTTSLFLTSVAHVIVIYATSPFLAAAIAWFWLGERVSRITAIATGISMLGVLIVVSGSNENGSIIGDAVAFGMTVSFALIIVLTKAHPNIRMLDISALSSLATSVLFLPLIEVSHLDLRNVGLVVMYGFTNLVLAFFLFLRGARQIAAATSGMIMTLEIALAPFWVWLFFNETIDRRTLIGGSMVAFAVVGHIVLSIARPRRAVVGAPI